MRSIGIRFGAAAIVACLLSAVSAPASARTAQCQLRMTTIPLQVVHYRPVAIVKINGLDVPMMVNTASAFTMLSPEIARELKLPLGPLPKGLSIVSNGTQRSAQSTVVHRLQVGDLDLKQVNVVVSEITTGLELQGVLGRDLLAAADIEYDLSRRVIRLITPLGDCDQTPRAYWAGSAPVDAALLAPPLEKGDTQDRIPISINGHPVTAFLGTGSQFSSISPQSARAVGIADDQLKPLSRSADADVRQVELDTFQLGTERLERQTIEVEAHPPDADYDVLLGVDYLLSHRVYIDHGRRMVFATRNGFPTFTVRSGFAPESPEARAAEAAMKVAQEDPDLWARISTFLYQIREFPDALEAINRAVALKPADPGLLLIRMRAHRGVADVDAALKDGDEALRLDPSLAEARWLRAGLRGRKNDRAGALADIEYLDRILPEDSEWRLGMGLVLERFDQVAQADRQIALWQASHPVHIDRAHAFNERCFMRTRRNLELAKAVQDCERAVEAERGGANPWDSLGWTRLRLGEDQPARAAFDEALRLDARHAWAHYGLSLILARQGDLAQARRHLDAARQSKSTIEDEIRASGLPTHEALP